MFQDEARFGRINDPRRCWAPRGVRPQVCARIVREYTYAFAALSPHDGTLDTLVLPEVKALAMSVFLAEVAQRHPQDDILLVLDGAGWHRGEGFAHSRKHAVAAPAALQSAVESGGASLGRDPGEVVSQSRLRQPDGRRRPLVEALAALENNPRQVSQITGFDWIASIPMNAT